MSEIFDSILVWGLTFSGAVLVFSLTIGAILCLRGKDSGAVLLDITRFAAPVYGLFFVLCTLLR